MNLSITTTLTSLQRNGLQAAFIVGVFFSFAGCNQMAGEAECDQAYTHLFNLRHQGEPEIVRTVKADEEKSKRFEFLKACVGQETKVKLECWLTKTSEKALSECKDDG